MSRVDELADMLAVERIDIEGEELEEFIADQVAAVRFHLLRASGESRARWSVWFYKPGGWLGAPVSFGNAEGCTRTLLIGTRWTGCIVFGLWRMRFDPECPECRGHEEDERE